MKSVKLEVLEAECRDLGRKIKKGLPPNTGFFLTLFDYGAPGPDSWWTYVSSGRGQDMVKFLREVCDKLAKETQ